MRRPRSCRQTGFTLVEVLLALAVLGLMTLLAWRGVSSMSEATRQSDTHGAAVQRVRIALAQWQADLDALRPLPRLKVLDFDGQRVVLMRSSPVPPMHTSAIAGGVEVVAWRISPQGRLQRWSAPAVHTLPQVHSALASANRWARTPQSEDVQRSVDLMPTLRWQLYYFRDNAWSNAQSSAGQQGQSESQKRVTAADESVPEGVRLVLEMPDTGVLAGVLTAQWVQPTLGATR